MPTNSSKAGFMGGFGSVMFVGPRRHKAMRFWYRGRDLAIMSAKEAIAGDWAMVVSDLNSAVEEVHKHDKSQSRELTSETATTS
jgi:hypothetical protein